MWFLVLLGLVASTLLVAAALTAVGWVWVVVMEKLGNPGGILRDRPLRYRGPGEGYYIDPQGDDGP